MPDVRDADFSREKFSGMAFPRRPDTSRSDFSRKKFGRLGRGVPESLGRKLRALFLLRSEEAMRMYRALAGGWRLAAGGWRLAGVRIGDFSREKFCDPGQGSSAPVD
jgi:hypothetical protein